MAFLNCAQRDELRSVGRGDGNGYIREGLYSVCDSGLCFNSSMDAVVALCVIDPNWCGKKRMEEVFLKL
jgi:hypothetical protein